MARTWRLAAFGAVLLLTLGSATLLVMFAIVVAGDFGLVQVRPLEITSQAFVTAVLGI